LFFAFVFGVVALVGFTEARELHVAKCNFDERQEMIQRFAKRDLPQQQNYENETTQSVQPGPIRILATEVDPENDKMYDAELKECLMACTKVNELVLMNNRPYTCTANDIPDSTEQYYAIVTVRQIFNDLAKMVSINRVVGDLRIKEGTYGGMVYLGNSISNAYADLVLYVTYRPDSWDTIASGTPLVFDQNGRSVFGLLNLNPRNLNHNSKLFYPAVLHEMIHILGFGQSQMMQFHNASTMDPKTGVSQPYSKLQLMGVESDGRELSLLTSPQVRESFIEQFDCPDAPGAVLEDQGGSSVAGSHWEMASFMGELMTATITERSVLSNMTLSLLEDSGWYTINRANASHLPWGYKMGCDFVYKRCNSSWPVGEGYFCKHEMRGKEGCTYDRTGIGSCDFRYWVSIPEKYRYFGEEHLGGPVEYADYCPFTYGTFLCTEKSSTTGSSYGDVTGSSSRCFMSTLSDNPDSAGRQPEAPKCYPHYCLSSESYAVQLGNYWYICPSGGNVSDIISFTGTVACANASLLCRGKGIDKKFPIFVSIEPKSAKPGDKVTITGKNLGLFTNITLGVQCEDVTVDAAKNSITCTIAQSSEVTAEAGLKNLIIKQNGYSIAVPNAFTLEVSVVSWILQNWFISACAAIGVLVLLLTIIVVCCKCCSRSRKWRKYQESKGNAGKKKSSNDFGDVEFSDLV